jgi:hypothetical protein
MRRIAEYKKFADECRQLARTLRKPEHKQRLELMATAWEMLALEREAQLGYKRTDSERGAVGWKRVLERGRT